MSFLRKLVSGSGRVALGESQDGAAEWVDQRRKLARGCLHFGGVHLRVAVAHQILQLHPRGKTTSQIGGQDALLGQQGEMVAQAGNRPPTLVSDDVRAPLCRAGG